MRLVVQRVTQASVEVEGEVCGKIEKGALVLLGIHKDDTEDKIPWLANKLANLRIFKDENDKMNLSLKDISGSALVVSQFTLYGDCSQGRRPSFLAPAEPEMADDFYLQFVKELRTHIPKVDTGKFGAYMKVDLTNDGPVTFILER